MIERENASLRWPDQLFAAAKTHGRHDDDCPDTYYPFCDKTKVNAAVETKERACVS
jgi:hypothetical protein